MILSLGFLKWFKDKEENDNEIVAVVKRVINEDLKDRLQVHIKNEGSHGYDICEYIEGKPNRSGLIIGGARSGKTVLGEFLCLKLPYRKIVVSFKRFNPMKRDFDLGFIWIDCSKQLPNIFSDAQSFTEAFQTAFFSSINMRGLAIDTILARVNDVMLQKPKDFEEFFETLEKISKRGQWEENITTMVKSKVELLKRATEGATLGSVDFRKGNFVLDLGNLNGGNEVKIFVAEYYLRQINRIEEVEQNGDMLYLCVDEAWNLLSSTQQSSILGTILLQGAYYIHVLCITQNYTHLDEHYRSQFGSIFCFKDNNDEDGKAIANGYSPFFSDAIKKLVSSEKDGVYQYLDLKFESNEDMIPVWQLNYAKLKREKEWIKQNSLAWKDDYFTQEQVQKTRTTQQQEEKDDVKTIIEILEKNEFCMTAHAITNALGYTEKDGTRSNIHKRTLPKLVDEGKIRKTDYITTRLKPDDVPRKYYYSVPNGESQVHRTVIKDAEKVLDKIPLRYEESQVNQGWDIYVGDFCIDAKTGLQNDVKDDVRKLLEKPNLKVIFVCTNYKVKQRYENDFSVVEGIEGKFRVCCLNELQDTIKAIAI